MLLSPTFTNSSSFISLIFFAGSELHEKTYISFSVFVHVKLCYDFSNIKNKNIGTAFKKSITDSSYTYHTCKQVVDAEFNTNITVKKYKTDDNIFLKRFISPIVNIKIVKVHSPHLPN